MVDNASMGKLLERFAQGVASHDRENPDHNSWGIGMAHFDIERLDLEEGEEILPGIVLQADGGVTGNFRVLCDGQHDGATGRARRVHWRIGDGTGPVEPDGYSVSGLEPGPRRDLAGPVRPVGGGPPGLDG